MDKNIEKPNDDDKLWRYMDLSKLISMFYKEELFFSAADKFEDPFEGAKGYKKDKEKWDDFIIEDFIKTPARTPLIDIKSIEGQELANKLIADFEMFGSKRRTATFINCWHLNAVESEAMWKIYSNDITNAVAIQTTYNKLKKALKQPRLIFIGKVNYINYNDIPKFYGGRFWYKRKSFAYENEVRAILHSNENAGSPGIGIHVNLGILIEKIYISPYAPEWFTDVLQNILDKYGIDKEIVRSSLLDEPLY